MRLFSYQNRPVDFGPLPLETLKRTATIPDLSSVQPLAPLEYDASQQPASLINGMRIYASYLDAARNGHPSDQRPDIPADIEERAKAIKSLGYFSDAKHVACCAMTAELFLDNPLRNLDLEDVANELGLMPAEEPGFHHMIGHGLIDGIQQDAERVQHHSHAVVIIVDHNRDVREDESAYNWLKGAGRHRASIRAAEIAVIIANFIRSVGFEARAHTESTSDVHLAKLAVAAGAADLQGDGSISHPYLGGRFALAAVTTTLELGSDQPLSRRGLLDRFKSHGPSWWLGGGPGLGRGMGTVVNATNVDAYRRRDFEIDTYGMSRVKRQEKPSTIVDEVRIPRSPKRADGFWRASYGDMGKDVQANLVDEFCVVKTPYGEAQSGLIGVMHLLSKRPAASKTLPGNDDPQANARRIKSALHFLGVDMVGISRAPSWVWYSHQLDGSEIEVTHDNAITLLVDQGHETMEGASGDDWIAASQSMRAYLRGMFLAGVVAEQIRRLGFEASVHSVIDSDVLHTPLAVLSGLGEMSRIGDIALNPFLGPRLKTTVITTTMPLAHDKPTDFGLQAFCSACNKCARECPSGAISAGEKVMFNGYETWKADIAKCTRYRVTQDKGSMCGRCMKTCPWNLEGLVVERPFRWLAMKAPWAAKWLAVVDDKLGHGNINPGKKWWWDIESTPGGVKQAVPPDRINVREIAPSLAIRPEEQTLACYPANLLPPPVPVSYPMDREAGIQAYRKLLAPDEYRARLAAGDTEELVPQYQIPQDAPGVQYLRIARREMMGEAVVRLELESPDGSDLMPFTAGAHIDLVIDAPFTRQYSLAGNPADRKRYVLGILQEADGRGGSLRVHERLFEGQIVPVTGPRNHFPLEEKAVKSLLIGGGIGVTPMLAMAHRLKSIEADFELHYCVHSRRSAGFLQDLQKVSWKDHVHLHVSDEGGRADLASLLGDPGEGNYLYTCGPVDFMDAVLSIGERLGWPEDNLRKEYFSVPEHDDYVNHAFEVHLAQSNVTLQVSAEKSLAEVLQAHQYPVVTKCADGLCGTCQLDYLAGDVEHRDYILSNQERESRIITCCSRAREGGDTLVLGI